MSVFVTVSARTYEELMWRKQQMTDMLKSIPNIVAAGMVELYWPVSAGRCEQHLHLGAKPDSVK